MIVSNEYPELQSVPIEQGAAGTTTVVTPPAGQRVVVRSLVMTMAAAGTFRFKSGAVNLSGPISLAANGGMILPPNGDGPWFATNEGEALTIVTTGGAANGVLVYSLED